jgi:Cu/Ag efflux pump CusA
LARAVIGGLLFATFATLVFVPAMYRLLRRRKPQPAPGNLAAENPLASV